MPNRILVPVDGSTHSANAVDLAASIARAQGGELYLVHVATERQLTDDERHLADAEYLAESRSDPVLRQLVGDGGNPDLVVPRIFARMREKETAARQAIGHHLLQEARARAEKAGAKVAGATVESGDAAAAIIASARRLGIDHIVMGARGLGSLGGIVLGSVSQKVVHLAQCPCTIVK